MSRAYVYRHRVPFEETNLTGNVYFAHYVRWQGHCREEFLAAHCPGVVALLDAGYALVTVHCSVDYLRECAAFDLVEVHMTLGRATVNRITMDFAYHRDGDPDGLVARGTQTVAFMRRGAAGLEPAPLQAELTAALAAYGGGR